MLARSVSLNVVGQFTSLAVGFLGSILLARLLGPSDRGLLGVMISVSDLGLLLLGAGVPVAIGYYASRSETRTGGLLGNALAYAAVLAAVLVPLAWLLHDPIADAFGQGRGGDVWALVALLVPATFMDWSIKNELFGTLRFGLANVLTVISKFIYLIAIIVLLGLLGLGVGAAVLALLIGLGVTVIGGIPVLVRVARPRLDGGLFRKLIAYGTRVQVGALLQQANFRLDVVILGFFRPLAEVGYYVVAQTIAELVVALAIAFKTSVLPLVSHFEGDERQDEMSATSARNYALIGGVATVANAGFGTLVIVFAYGPEFREAVAPMLVILPGIWFLGLGTVIAGDLQGRGRPGLSSLLSGLAAVVTVGLDLSLIPSFGIMGAAVASLVAYTVLGVGSLIALHRISGIPARELLVPKRRDLTRYRLALAEVVTRLRRS